MKTTHSFQQEVFPSFTLYLYSTHLCAADVYICVYACMYRYTNTCTHTDTVILVIPMLYRS